nr:HycuOrf-136/ODV-E26 [Hyphantria cunea nucleopolyhedrovirus]UIX56408.1 HycuOrf-136/ODV-E26 [Hyphantria cunea nucleopolyhedrovirus]
METTNAASMLAPQSRPGAVRAYVKTVVTTTTLSESDDNNKRIAQIIAQLQRTRLNFFKLSQLQKRRVRNMQKLIRKKNNVIATLVARLNARHDVKTKHFAVGIYKNVVYTTSGSEQFVRQRIKKMGGEQVFLARRVDCERDRRRIAEALTAALGAGVVVLGTNKRFEVTDPDKVISAKLIVQQVLHNGYHSDVGAY